MRPLWGLSPPNCRSILANCLQMAPAETYEIKCVINLDTLSGSLCVLDGAICSMLNEVRWAEQSAFGKQSSIVVRLFVCLCVCVCVYIYTSDWMWCNTRRINIRRYLSQDTGSQQQQLGINTSQAKSLSGILIRQAQDAWLSLVCSINQKKEKKTRKQRQLHSLLARKGHAQPLSVAVRAESPKCFLESLCARGSKLTALS